LSGVHTDFLDKVRGFLDDFIESGLGPFGGIHLVDSNDELFDTKSISKQSVLTSLSVLGNTSFEFTDTSSNDDFLTLARSNEKGGGSYE
jgi:hypothetical protein